MSEAEVQQQYARIVTNHAEMSEILGYLRMNGKDTDGQTISLVQDVILHFEDGKVHARVFDPMKSVWCDYHREFDGIKREGELVIGDVSEFLNYLGRFGEKTIIDQTTPDDESTVHLLFNDEDRKTGGYPATDEEHINSQKSVDDLPYEYDAEEDDEPSAPEHGIYLDTWFRVNVAEINDVLSDGETTQVRTYPITANDGHITVRVGDDSGFIQTEFQADEGEGEAASVYGYGMDNVFSNLSGEVNIYFTDDAAMWVHQETEDHTVDYMIADDE